MKHILFLCALAESLPVLNICNKHLVKRCWDLNDTPDLCRASYQALYSSTVNCHPTEDGNCYASSASCVTEASISP